MGLVIDTNVLEHADNPNEPRYEEAIEFLNHIQTDLEEFIYVDHSLSPDESFILNEYRDRLVPGNYGYTIFLLLIQQGRITPISRSVNGTVAKKIRKWAHKPVDVIFVKVTYNSSEKILVSHDYDDFPQKARDSFRKEIAVNIKSASEYIGE